MAVIIPCAGKSSRYPNTLPKYLLDLDNGKLMFEKTVENLNTKQDIYFIIPHEHQKKFKSKDVILSKKNKKNFKVFTIKKNTNGPAETVYKIPTQHAILNIKKYIYKLHQKSNTSFIIELTNDKIQDYYFESKEELENHSLKEDINSFLSLLN